MGMYSEVMKDAYEVSQEEIKLMESINKIRGVLSSIIKEYHDNLSEDSLSFSYLEMREYLDTINKELKVLEK